VTSDGFESSGALKCKSKCDLIVIGGGSGSIAMANRAASYGAKVALIEAGRLGGTCVNVGCVPKKIMWNAASIAHVFHEAGDYGFTAKLERFDWGALKKSRDDYVAWLNGRYQAGLEKNGVEWIRGRARFDGPRAVAVNGARLEAPNIAIATGGRPIIPAWKGAELGITSDGFFELPRQPRRVAIVGAGYVAVELAGVFRALGSRSLLVRRSSVLMSFDELLREAVMREMTADGIEIHTNTHVREAVRETSGITLRRIEGADLKGFDCVLWAVGREPVTDDLNLAAAGVKDRHGAARRHRRVAEHQCPRHLRRRRRNREGSADASRDRRRTTAFRPPVRRPGAAQARLREHPDRDLQPSASGHGRTDRSGGTHSARRRSQGLQDGVHAALPRVHAPEVEGGDEAGDGGQGGEDRGLPHVRSRRG
jgi:NADPH-dependent 2,4-dienoyl-CoA reductase/sulfur reductase-like enzyme